VSSVCFHTGDKTHKSGVYVNLRCGCGAKQEGPVRKSSKRPTFGDCLRELGRLIQQDHGPTCVSAAQKLQAAEKDAAVASTKRSHDEGDTSFNTTQVLSEIEEQFQPKRARSDADTGDAHEILTEVDNWDLRDHHREGTRVQNRRNVQVGKSHPGKDGFLLHTCLGLVGWIARQGTHDDRKNNVAHSSGSALAIHVFQKGVAHGTRKYVD
jgi:hypothetical protein